MRIPAYGKTLISARAAGREPWLVSLAIGKLRDTRILPGVSGVARVGWDDPLTMAQAQWGLLVGLNVLISPFWEEDRHGEPTQTIMETLWKKGRPGTLWFLTEDAQAESLSIWTGSRGDFNFHGSRQRYTLDANFRKAVEIHRHTLLLMGEGLFALPEFSGVRDSELAAIQKRLQPHAAG